MVNTDAPSMKLLVLPEQQSSDARICTLAHPRTLAPSRYYFDPEKGIYEFTKVAAPRTLPRSWLIARRVQPLPRQTSTEKEIKDSSRTTSDDGSLAVDEKGSGCSSHGPVDTESVFAGHVSKTAELLIATPIDYVFLLLPAFAQASSVKSSSSNGLFFSVDDLLEKLFEDSKHLEWLSNHPSARLAIEERMKAICDTVDAGDECMYRLNDNRLLKELVSKVKHMVTIGLPASIEEKFISRALESPIMALKHEDSIVKTTAPENDITRSDPTSSDLTESQASTATTETKMSTTSGDTEITVPDNADSILVDGELYHLLRIRTALSYMTSVYLSADLAVRMQTLLASEESPINFKPLEERLATIAQLRADALAARSLGDFSRKRSMFEEDEAAESRAEKKRRKEEEEKKKKAGESRTLRDLRKVDTKGMKKMSDFFGKGAATKKK